jgi:hypothetical protein
VSSATVADLAELRRELESLCDGTPPTAPPEPGDCGS